MPMNAGDFDVTTGLAKRILDRWTGDSRNGFSSPLPPEATLMLRSQVYSVAKEVVDEVLNNFHVIAALNQVSGPLPVTSAAFTTSGGTLLVLFGGSARSASTGITQTLSLKIDGSLKGSSALYFDQANVHQAFPASALVVTGVPAGSHTLSLETTATTYSYDKFNATVVELPF